MTAPPKPILHLPAKPEAMTVLPLEPQPGLEPGQEPGQDVIAAEKVPGKLPDVPGAFSSADDMDFDIVSTRG